MDKIPYSFGRNVFGYLREERLLYRVGESNRLRHVLWVTERRRTNREKSMVLYFLRISVPSRLPLIATVGGMGGDSETKDQWVRR